MEEDGFLQLVAEPVRWRLLGALARSDHRVGELTRLAGKQQSLVSYHLRELRDAGLVSARRSSADGRDTYYRLDARRCARLFEATAATLQPGLRWAGAGASPAADERPRSAKRTPPRVLFLCTGNSARSQMAEALAAHLSDGTVVARSAGSDPKALHPHAVRVMAERGIDIADRPTKHLDRFRRDRFDWVVTLCDRVREVCPEFPHGPATAHWSMADPSADGSYAAFEATAAEVEERMALFLPRLALDEETKT